MDTLTGMSIQHVPVLIVGSSMVGMTLSVLLAKHGLEGCMTVEKHASTAIHPRAAYFHPRSMEIYCELGVYDEMLAESARLYDSNAGIYDLESLAGKYIQTWLGNINEGIENVSPVTRTFLTQHMFEPILRRYSEKNGVDLQFSTELVSFQQDSSGVTAIVRSTETGEKRIVHAKYMVACDGNRSPGKAGPDLVEKTYHDERYPVGKKTVAQVFERYIRRTAPELKAAATQLEDEVPEPYIELGYRYHSAALMTDELGGVLENPQRATCRPGSHAPHVLISLNGEDGVPIANLFRGTYTLLLGSDASGWEDAARELDMDKTLPEIRRHRVHGDAFYSRYGLSQRGAALVRPDGFVAWCDWQGPAPGTNAVTLLADVMLKILCRVPHASSNTSPSELTVNTPSLSSALFAREKQLFAQKLELQKQMDRIDTEIADLRRMDELQNETALLALRLMPAEEKPPGYSYSECLRKKEAERVTLAAVA
ncbi:hypothetical protein M8818_007665 [Zalaria obscura]|uniref:Uncharacterized protein n=1 Tax=Zalaria obscura TaxID=2024903 RepID=A0ACC3S2W6_9PEZI